MNALNAFREIWLVDFEFSQPSGETPTPVCLVAREYCSGRTLRIGMGELSTMQSPPFSIESDALFVAYYASAELNCFLALGWSLPVRILDLYVEFRRITSGLPVPCGYGLLGALAYYGLDGIAATEKTEMRELAIRGGPYTEAEMASLLEYCETDVVALARLIEAMEGELDLPRAVLRGRYMAAAARMETNGIPVDVETFKQLQDGWDEIKSRLIVEVDADYGAFVPTYRREVNPESPLGQAIITAAKQHELDVHELADAVHQVWVEQRESTHAFFEAKREARRATGLTPPRLSRWENGLGRDHSTFPGLDTTARELAGRYPALGLGCGYGSGNGQGASDCAARLWELLRDERDRPKPKHDPDIVNAAVDMLLASRGSVQSGPWSFSAAKWAEYLAKNDIPWPRLESGALDLSDDAFREMSRRYPQIAPMRELRYALSQMRLSELAVGRDGRNRCMLSAFGSKTGRNQPSNSKFLFGPSCWLRGLIKPEPRRAIAYVDWSQQEFGIGAALSGDAAMMEAYASGDPYLTFAKQAGAVTADATKQSHPNERELFKTCALGVQYGMGSASLAARLGKSEALARRLLGLHRQTYPKFWRWSQAAVDHAMLYGRLHTIFGWEVHVGARSNPRSLANFPCQANGAEMLRLACCLATEKGIRVCAPVHDAVLIEDSIAEIEASVLTTQDVMRDASRIILDGFELRTDAEIVQEPARYMDERGRRMWETVTRLLKEVDTCVDVPF